MVKNQQEQAWAKEAPHPNLQPRNAPPMDLMEMMTMECQNQLVEQELAKAALHHRQPMVQPRYACAESAVNSPAVFQVSSPVEKGAETPAQPPALLWQVFSVD